MLLVILPSLKQADSVRKLLDKNSYWNLPQFSLKFLWVKASRGENFCLGKPLSREAVWGGPAKPWPLSPLLLFSLDFCVTSHVSWEMAVIGLTSFSVDFLSVGKWWCSADDRILGLRVIRKEKWGCLCWARCSQGGFQVCKHILGIVGIR